MREHVYLILSPGGGSAALPNKLSVPRPTWRPHHIYLAHTYVRINKYVHVAYSLGPGINGRLSNFAMVPAGVKS
jgi:hypothetical protein